MKYLVYARRRDELGEEYKNQYYGYRLIEGATIMGAVNNWWDAVTDSTKELHAFNRRDWELEQDYFSQSYIIRHNSNYWMTYNIMVIPLASYSEDDAQELDNLNINLGEGQYSVYFSEWKCTFISHWDSCGICQHCNLY